MIFRFRVVLDNDTKEDIFRDIEIRDTDTLEDLHNVITQSFGFDGSEMASFYISDDEWNQGEEISLFDMSEGGSDIQLMSQTILNSSISYPLSFIVEGHLIMNTIGAIKGAMYKWRIFNSKNKFVHLILANRQSIS